MTWGDFLKAPIRFLSVLTRLLGVIFPKRVRAVYRESASHTTISKTGIKYQMKNELLRRRFERLDSGEIFAENFFEKLLQTDGDNYIFEGKQIVH